MARIRSTKPEFWSSYSVGQLSREARMLYQGLWNFVDEHARGAGDTRVIKGQVFPYDDDLDADAVGILLDELVDAGKVVRYTVDGAPYVWVPSLGQHQRLEPSKARSRCPEPPQVRADSSAPMPEPPDPVDNPPGGPRGASAQVNGTSEVRADKSAPRAEKSPPSYVAGSMEHAAAAAREPLPPQLAILRRKLEARKLLVRWDRLTPEQVDDVTALVELHGDGPLIEAALRAYRADSPPVFAQAWLGTWLALPAPGDRLRLADKPRCTQPGHSGPADRCAQCASEALETGSTR